MRKLQNIAMRDAKHCDALCNLFAIEIAIEIMMQTESFCTKQLDCAITFFILSKIFSSFQIIRSNTLD